MARLVRFSQHVADWQEQTLVVETVIEDSVFFGPFLANRPRRGLNCVIFVLEGGTEMKRPVFTHRGLGFC
jgi:hypothetical protein